MVTQKIDNTSYKQYMIGLPLLPGNKLMPRNQFIQEVCKGDMQTLGEMLQTSAVIVKGEYVSYDTKKVMQYITLKTGAQPNTFRQWLLLKYPNYVLSFPYGTGLEMKVYNEYTWIEIVRFVDEYCGGKREVAQELLDSGLVLWMMPGWVAEETIIGGLQRLDWFKRRFEDEQWDKKRGKK